MSAYSAINVMIQNAAPDVFNTVLGLAPILMQRLVAALGMTVRWPIRVGRGTPRG